MELNKFHIVDAIKGMAELSPGSVDLVVTDPPYWTLEKHRGQGTTARLTNSKASSNEWFEVQEEGYFPEFFAQCYRVLRSRTHMYVFCDPETQRAIEPMILEAGFTLRRPLIWRKVGKKHPVNCPRCGVDVGTRRNVSMSMGYPYRACYEVVVLAQKGRARKAPENKGVREILDGSDSILGMLDIVRELQGHLHTEGVRELLTQLQDQLEAFDRPGDMLDGTWIKSKKAYPTQKPVELIETMILQSSQEGDLILDPFAGSGSTLWAAKNTQRRYLGFDLSETALAAFEARGPIQEVKPPESPVSTFLEQFLV